MKLNKEQIATIDTYLKENKVEYWDVRLEMIDHLASKLEKQQQVILTKNLLIKEFGSSISLEKTLDVKRKSVNKKSHGVNTRGFFYGPILLNRIREHLFLILETIAP